MAAMPIHPRLARLALQGCQAGVGSEACEVAAKLGDTRFGSTLVTVPVSARTWRESLPPNRPSTPAASNRTCCGRVAGLNRPLCRRSGGTRKGGSCGLSRQAWEKTGGRVPAGLRGVRSA